MRLAGDLPEVRLHYVNVAKRLRAPDLSPTGARAVFEARGEIVTVPAEKGDARNVTRRTGAKERNPVWSPDGQTIAYLSDESGEYQLHLRNQDGAGEVKKINLGGKPAFYSSPEWSPDSKKILYLDNHLHLWYMDVGQQKPVLVDTDIIRTAAIFHRPGRRIVSGLLIRRTLKSHMSAVFLYSLTNSAVSTSNRRHERRRLTGIRPGTASICTFWPAQTPVHPASPMSVTSPGQ